MIKIKSNQKKSAFLLKTYDILEVKLLVIFRIRTIWILFNGIMMA